MEKGYNESEMMKQLISITASVVLLTGFSCGGQQAAVTSGQGSPEFDAASAYAFVKAQVDFGPRVPGTPAHAACADWLVKTLKQWTPDVSVQAFKARAYDGRPLDGKNIVASFEPGLKDRLLLCAHWDSRPFADHDPDPANHFRPVMGANDGASGVGVLLEIARALSVEKPAVGVDIVLFDLEDFGEHRNWRGSNPDSWGLGSQYWAKTPHKPGYKARFGILLDMVGGANPVFPREGTSLYYAPAVVKKIWAAAKALGYGRLFVDRESGSLIDDHLYVNQYAGIPTADIIDYDERRANGFPDSWHTVGDTLDKIDKATLEAVGRTVLAVVRGER